MLLGKLPVPGRPTILIFNYNFYFSLLFLPLWETARYRLKYCLKGPLSPKQPIYYHGCMVWIKKNLSLGITVRHHSASLLMPISDPRDRFFYPHHS